MHYSYALNCFYFLLSRVLIETVVAQSPDSVQQDIDSSEPGFIKAKRDVSNSSSSNDNEQSKVVRKLALASLTDNAPFLPEKDRAKVVNAIKKAKVKDGQLNVEYNRKSRKQGEEVHFEQHVSVEDGGLSKGSVWSSETLKRIRKPKAKKNRSRERSNSLSGKKNRHRAKQLHSVRVADWPVGT